MELQTKYQELVYWLALRDIPGVGDVLFRALVDVLGNPKNVFDASLQQLVAVPGIGLRTARQILAYNQWEKAEGELRRIHDFPSSLVTYRDPLYPRNLLQIYDYPPFLYVRGTLEPTDIPVAVVGSRLATPYGRFTTERIGRELALMGVTVVSGLARGIDTAAHRGAISARGRTVAVLGCGLDVVYPPENVKLYRAIADNGALISEYPLGTSPHRLNFPARNRIISGMSHGVVIVEAGEKSGSLITARLALEQGREVFAVPGAIDSPASRGTHKLIREGARLVESAREIAEEIYPQLEKRLRPPEGNRDKQRPLDDRGLPGPQDKTVSASPIGAAIIERLTQGPGNVDELAAVLGVEIAKLQLDLLSLELQGVITKKSGNLYELKGSKTYVSGTNHS